MDSKQKAEELVNGKRQADYGHPKVNMKRIARIWSGILDIDVTPEQVALCMAGLKLARLVHSPDHEDTQVDMLGYLKVLQRLLDPEDQPTPSMETVTGAFNTFKPKPDPFSDWTEEEKKRGWKVRGNPTEPWAPGPYELKPEDAPTITFTGEPQATMKEDEILWAKFGDGTVGPVKVYADGSKDMTFEEAVAPSILMQDPVSGHAIKCDTATAISILAEKGYIQVEEAPSIRRNPCGQ